MSLTNPQPNDIIIKESESKLEYNLENEISKNMVCR